MADFDMTWAKMDPDHVPPEIDTTHPSVARVYDAILGGRDNFAVDRAVAAEAVKHANALRRRAETLCERG